MTRKNGISVKNIQLVLGVTSCLYMIEVRSLYVGMTEQVHAEFLTFL